jgi:hypothetical protein
MHECYDSNLLRRVVSESLVHSGHSVGNSINLETYSILDLDLGLNENMSTDKYIDDAKRMFAYFDRNMPEGGDLWKHGYDVSKRWRELVSQKSLLEPDIEQLIQQALNPPEEQGCAYSELIWRIKKWSREIVL